MIWSVYKYGSKSYDYYDDGQPSPTHAGAPPIVAMGGVGEPPEAAAWRVPLGAKKVGSGELPRGRVASMSGTPDSSPSIVKVGIAIGAAYLIWRHLK